MPPVFGPDVAVADPLEVLGRAEGHDPEAVGKREQRDLVALEQLLDHDIAAERLHRVQRVGELLLCLADEDTFARGEAVGLDDARRACDRQRRCHRHACRPQHVLREGLRPFDARGRGTRPENGDAILAQRVRDTRDERAFRPDHDEVGRERHRKAEQTLGILRPHRMAPAERCDAGIAGRGVQFASGVGSARGATPGRARALQNRRRAPSRRRVYSSGWRAQVSRVGSCG